MARLGMSAAETLLRTTAPSTETQTTRLRPVCVGAGAKVWARRHERTDADAAHHNRLGLEFAVDTGYPCPATVEHVFGQVWVVIKPNP